MQARFQLIRHFTVTSLMAFACAASAMVYFQMRESARSESTRLEAFGSFERLQADLVSHAATALQRDALITRQDSHVELAQALSVGLWDEALSPFLAAAKKIDFSACRGQRQPAGAPDNAPMTSPTCLGQPMARVQALPAHATLDARLQHALRGNLITGVRIHDLQGNTLYSSDRRHVGDNITGVAGWAQAARGLPSSALLPPAAPGGVQGADPRNLMTSHVPVSDPVTHQTAAVLELQSDVTAQLHRVQQTSADIRNTAAIHLARLEQQSLAHRRHAQRAESVQLMTLAGLLALLFAVLHAIVRRAQGVIEKQARESDANKQRLAQSEKMTSLGNMVASVAHQLNTPLAFSKSNVSMAMEALKDMAPGIRSAAQVLDRMAGSADATATHRSLDLDTDTVRSQLTRCPDELGMTQDMLSDVLTGLNQMNEMVDNLRSFTRLDRSRTAEVDLNTTLSSVIYLARAVISTRVQVVQKFSALPRLECQVSQLNQVFLNLIMNAAQAIDGAGVVTVSTTVHGACVRITVEDNGSGIPDDVLPRIFEPYFTTKPMGSGTGLGLAIARDIVAEHGGTLTVTSQVGVGTTFQIELPMPTGAST